MKKRSLSLLLALAIVLTTVTAPAFAASTADLKQQKETEHFVFYCMDQDVEALDDLVESFESCYDRVTTDLGKAPSGKTNVYIYPDIQSYHEAMGRTDDPDWVVGEAKNGAIHMTSPLNPGPAHDYDDLIQIAVHEFTHIVINLFGNVPIYLHEGVACYEAQQYQYQDLSAFIKSQMSQNKVPSLSTLENFTSFSDGVYEYSYAYVDFVARLYGFDKVVELLEGKSRKEALGSTNVADAGDATKFNQFWWNVLRLLYVDDRDSLTQCLETDNFILTFAPQDTEAVSELAERLENTRAEITADLGVTPKVKTIIRVYPDLDSLHKAAYQPQADDSMILMSAYAYRYNNFLVVSPGNPGTVYDRASVIGNMARSSAKTVLYLFENAPTYLFEGLALYYSKPNTSNIKEYIKKAADNNALPTLTELEKLAGNDAYTYAFADFALQNVGGKGVASLLEGKSQETVFGMTAQQLEEKWQAFLKDYDKQVSAPNLDTNAVWIRCGKWKAQEIYLPGLRADT